MPTYGLTATGFLAKPAEVIKAEMDAFQKANINSNWDTSSGSVMGQWNGNQAESIAAAWEALAAAYDTRDPDNATNAALVSVAALTGTLKQGKTKATVTLTCNLDAGTYTAGQLIASKAGDPTARFVNTVAQEVTSGPANFEIPFEAETAGPLEAGIGTITVIAEPVTGWNSVNNAAAAVPGEDIETDPDLRVRRVAELAAQGSSRVAAMVVNVKTVAGVVSASGLENKTNATDANGLPSHSFEILVWDNGGAADDDEIAQAIWDKTGSSIGSFGTSSGTAVDAAGNNHTVKFSRLTEKAVHVEIDLTKIAATYIGDAAVALAVETWAAGFFTQDQDVIESKIAGIASTQTGVQDVTEVRLGFSASPTGTANLAIGIREIATIDDANVTIASSDA